MQITRDRTGLQQSVLKVPLWLKNNDKLSQSNGDEDNTSMREHEYEYISQVNNSVANMSCVDLSKDMLIKGFNRSKSNMESFSNSSIIRPLSDKNHTMSSGINDAYSDRGQADGGSNQQDSDFDEFSSQDGEDDEQSCVGRKGHQAMIEKTTALAKTNGIHKSATEVDHNNVYQNSKEIQQAMVNSNGNTSSSEGAMESSNIVLSRCKALYSYSPKLYDELELNPGDIIEVHAKQDDGWWLGALNNQVGIFPATYVEELD